MAQEGRVEAFSALMPRWMVAVFLGSPWNSVNTKRSRQDGCYFADDVLKCIFLDENVWISLKILLNVVPMVPIDNIPALVQIMAWRRPGNKPLSEPMLVLYRRIYTSLGLNEWMQCDVWGYTSRQIQWFWHCTPRTTELDINYRCIISNISWTQYWRFCK